jgi:WD40 repeat protein/predicted Ser/Thr protein kinase
MDSSLQSAPRTGGPVCAVCGSSLPPGKSLFGLCPRCLAAGAIEEENEAPESPQRIGRYEILGEIGRGGMGVVFRAVDPGLRREVALKLLPSGLLASRAAMRRFFTEAQAAARLGHPNIVPIYEIGDGTEGQPFLAMQFIAGGTLADLLKGGPLQPVAAVALLEKISYAIQHAHERGILHRDIKPGNILLNDGDEPLVADFGLARLIEADSSLTQPEAVLGTPAYLAPELAAGRAHEVTVLADIYALGAVLYECLAGRPAFSAGTTAALLRKIIEEEPPPLRRSKGSTASSATDRDLETICLKCLEKEPGRRYASAAALAEDLARWRRGEPIHARPSTMGERVVKWARRRPLIAALSAGLIAVGVAGLIGVLLEWQRARAGERVALLNEYAADMAVVNQSLLAGDKGRARTLLSQHQPKPGQPDLRGWEWSYFYSQANHSDELTTLGKHPGLVWWAAFSPDSHWLATADLTGEMRLWDIRTRSLAAQAKENGWPSSLKFTADGRFLICVQDEIRWWSVPSLREARPPLMLTNLTQALPSPDGRQLFAIQNGNGIARLTPDGKATLPADEAPQTHAPAGFGAFSPDGSLFAYEARDGLVAWDLIHDTMQVFPGHQWRTGFPYTVSGLAFSSDDSVLVSSGYDGAVRVWALKPNVSQDSVRELTNTGGVVNQIAFIDGGTLLAGGSTDETIHLWDAHTWKPVRQLRGHGSAVLALAASPDGTLLASGSMDGEVKLWSPTQPATRPTVLPLPGYLVDTSDINLFLAPDGSHLLTRDARKQTLQLWNTATLELQTNIPAPPPEFQGMALLGPGGRWIAFRGTRGTRLVPSDGSSNAMPRTFTNTWIVGFSSDGRRLFSTDGEGTFTVRVWDAESGLELESAVIDGSGGIRTIAVSHDGQWIAFGFFGGRVSAWNCRGHQALQFNTSANLPVSGLAFSPDNKQLAAVSYDSQVRVYDLSTGRQSYHMTASSFELDSVTWSPDGHRLVTGASDGIVRIWEVDTRPVREVAVLPGHNNVVEAMAFTADGSTLVTVSRDSLRVWRTDQSLR